MDFCKKHMTHEPIQTRRYVDIALFSAIGGILEASLGTLVHTFRLVPFAGVLPTAALITVLSALYAYRHSAKDVLRCGTVIALLKFLSPGGTTLFSVGAVLVETIMFSSGLSLLHSLSVRIRLVISALPVIIWPVIQRILVLFLFVGITAPELLNSLMRWTDFKTDSHWLFYIVLISIFLAHAVAGATAAFVGWLLGIKLDRFRTVSK